ncbi:hypothetical protein MARPO_0048s0075 [Marchantia polymorpha]|nr:hypothetical protein MARPO_0048s0075 [Marchantia polymorpha]|eukprot:PTQ38966.1 hypothetical protein MARPO_0048s0075 [Marchantia polymorpha]
MHVVPMNLPVYRLSCREAWNELTETQKHFVHHFSRASWNGSRICAKQLSQESPDILRLLVIYFSSSSLSDLKRRCLVGGITIREWDLFLTYSTCFLTNMGNYLAFGDLKIVPGISEDKFELILKLCPLQDQKREGLMSLWEKTRKRTFSLAPGERHLGMPPGGTSAYYSPNITLQDVNLVSEWMRQANIEPWNTRIFKKESSVNSDTLPEYDVRIASSLDFPIETYNFENKCIINIVRGDLKEELHDVVEHLKQALVYADNDCHREMVKCFIDYLQTGSVDFHKRSQLLWLNENDPSLEINIGFIETYRDPTGSRAEFEGFVAFVNKARTKQFGELAKKADVLLSSLPWPKDFEADQLQCGTFTCIDVFCYANGTIPTGINLPNYQDVRQTYGCRNVCLSNVLEAHYPDTKTTFLRDDDIELLKRTKKEVFIVQLACHELLGHGSGKLFSQDSGGVYNFPYGKIKHPFTHEAVVSCYGPGETWNSKFGGISGAFEECRAECVGLFLSTNSEAMEIFGHVGPPAENIMYINWLMMARAGFLALEYFSPNSGDWRQAHMQARFAILRTLLEASIEEAEENAANKLPHGADLLQIRPRGPNDVVLCLNRSKIRAVGLPAISDLLLKLQVYKSTADWQEGQKFFQELTTVPRELMKYRKIIRSNKRPQPMFVQVNTRMQEVDGRSEVILEEFEASADGVVRSHLAHFEDWVAQI